MGVTVIGILEFLNFQYILKLQKYLIWVKWGYRQKMKYTNMRPWLVWWMYAVAVGHLGMGLVMTWFGHLPLLADYHQSMIGELGFQQEIAQAKAMQLWWVALFGATLQAFALFMLALIYMGNRYRNARVWCSLMVAILLWAPQDIFLSLQKSAWLHVWADVFAFVVIVPPLLLLWLLDRHSKES